MKPASPHPTSLRLALLAPLVAPIAPPYLGGAQALLRDLVAGLAARGHSVTLYATRGSQVPGARTIDLGISADAFHGARVQVTTDGQSASSHEALDATFFAQADAFLRMALHIAGHADEYDLVHAHAYDWPAFAFGALLPLPVLQTLHAPATSRAISTTLRTLAADAPNTRLSTVSRACAATYAPDVAIDTIVANGVDLAAIPFGPRPDANPEPYLLFAGRMAPEKGVVDALAIAARAGRRILVAGASYDDAYFTGQVRPALDTLEAAGRAEYLGVVPRERLWRLMAGAEAVLCPIQWEEPFGLVACEAQAAGAPVIGYARGALPDVVADGVTGYLVPPGDLDAVVAAVARVGGLDRAACRAHIAERFSLEAMLDGYERVYSEMLATSPSPSDGAAPA